MKHDEVKAALGHARAVDTWLRDSAAANARRFEAIDPLAMARRQREIASSTEVIIQTLEKALKETAPPQPELEPTGAKKKTTPW